MAVSGEVATTTTSEVTSLPLHKGLCLLGPVSEVQRPLTICGDSPSLGSSPLVSTTGEGASLGATGWVPSHTPGALFIHWAFEKMLLRLFSQVS